MTRDDLPFSDEHRVLVSARTEIGGRCYRQVVIGSRAHRVLLRRLLRAVGRHAERHRAD